ncbi:MAG: YraN family protein [Gammaproteobacteria bacterium]|nr:YraN family protein [Gammaproteobacteria bacterium]
MINEARKRGNEAESVALKLLQTHGLRLIEKNFQCKRGEIDLIMAEDQQAGNNCIGPSLIFVEVRYRKNDKFGHAAESITAEKMSRIISTAEYFRLKYRDYDHWNCRFDVVTLSGSENGKTDWIRNAFSSD